MGTAQFSTHEVVAMWLFRELNAGSSYDPPNFYKALNDRQRQLVKKMTDEISATLVWGNTSESGTEQAETMRAQMERDAAALCPHCRTGNAPVLHKLRGQLVFSHSVDADQDIWEKCLAAPIRLAWSTKSSVPSVLGQAESE